MDGDTPNGDAVEAYVKLCRELGVECCLEVLAAITTPSRSCSLTDRASPLRDVDVKCIAGMLRQHDVLDILNIEGNEIEQDGILSIANMLKKNTSLHTLRLGANKFRDGGVITLAHSLSVNTTLTSLDLSHNRIGGVGVKALAQVLGTSSNINELVLHGNVIDSSAAGHLCDALQNSKSMQHLHLGYNDLAGKGTLAFAKLLRFNPFLATLDISNNRVTDAEGAVLMDAIAVANSSLERLNVRSNLLGEKSFTCLARALPRSHLREVFLGFNNPPASCVEAVVSAARSTPQLRTLDIHGCKLHRVAPVCELVRSNGNFSCLLLDGVICSSEEEVAAQSSEWDRAWSARRRYETTDRWTLCYVGKEGDKVDGGPSTGPAFFIGDKEAEVKLIASEGSTQVSASPLPESRQQSSPSPVIPRLSHPPIESFAGKAAPSSNDDLVKVQLVNQVRQLEMRLEHERSSHQMQLTNLEERLRNLETVDTTTADVKSEPEHRLHDLDISNATIPQHAVYVERNPEPSPYPSPTSITKLRNQRREFSDSKVTSGSVAVSGNNSVEGYLPDTSRSRSLTILQQEAMERGRRAEKSMYETVVAREHTHTHTVQANDVHTDMYSDRKRSNRAGSSSGGSVGSYGMPGAHRCPSRSGRSCSRSRSPLRERPILQAQSRKQSPIRERSPVKERLYLSPPAPKPSSVAGPITVIRREVATGIAAPVAPLSAPVPASYASRPVPVGVAPSSTAARSHPVFPPPVAAVPAAIDLPHMQNPPLAVATSANSHTRAAFGSTKKSPVCPEPSDHSPLKAYMKKVSPKGVADNVPLSAWGKASKPTEKLVEPVRRGRSPKPMPAAKAQDDTVSSSPQKGNGPSVWHQVVRGTQREVSPAAPSSRNPSPAPGRAASNTPGELGGMPRMMSTKKHGQSKQMVSPQRSSAARKPSRSPRPVSHEAPTLSVPVLQDSRRPLTGTRGLREASASSTASRPRGPTPTPLMG